MNEYKLLGTSSKKKKKKKKISQCFEAFKGCLIY